MDQFSTVLTLAVLGASVTLGWHFLLGPRRLRPVFCDCSTAARWGLLQTVVILGIWISSQILVSWIFVGDDLESLQSLAPDQQQLHNLLSGGVQSLALVLAMFFLAIQYQTGLATPWFAPWNKHWRVGTAALLGVVGLLVWAPIVWTFHAGLVQFFDFKYQHPTFEFLKNSPSALGIVMSWLSAVLFAPIIEEILFRGLLQGWLQRLRRTPKTLAADTGAYRLLYGDSPSEIAESKAKKSPKPFHWPALLISSTLFGLAHYSQGPAPISLFVFGLGIGYLYQRSGSLLACIVMHGLFNIAGMTLETINRSSSAALGWTALWI